MTRYGWKYKLKCVALALTMALPSIALAQTTGDGGALPLTGDSASGEEDTSSSPVATSVPPVDTSSTASASTGVVGDASSAGVAPTGQTTPSDEVSTVEAPEALDGATYRVRLRDLEQRVDELKEQIRRSHTRLSLLSDTILSGAAGGARAEIEFINDLSGAWHVIEAVFVLDGAVQYKKSDDTGVLAQQRTIPIFSGSVPTGDHTLQVMLKLRGHGFGVFSYLRGIEASVTSNHSFTVTDGKVVELRATAWEQGGPTTPVEQQPAVRFKEVVKSASDSPSPVKSSPTPQTKRKTPITTGAGTSATSKSGANSQDVGVTAGGGTTGK